MFCTNCGQKLEDGAAFCTNCGKPVEVQPGGVPAGAAAPKKPVVPIRPVCPEKPAASAPSPKKLGTGMPAENKLGSLPDWLSYVPYGICGLAAVMGMMKWIQIKIPFFDTFNGSYHIWSLVSLLKDLAEWTGEDDLATAGVVVAIPLIFWILGILVTGVGAVLEFAAKNKKVAAMVTTVASACMAMSGLIYLYMVSAVKQQINEEMHQAIGFSIGGNIIRVPVWPKAMLFLGIAGIVVSVLVVIKHTGRPIGKAPAAGQSGNAMPDTEVQPIPRIPYPEEPAQRQAPAPVRPAPAPAFAPEQQSSSASTNKRFDPLDDDRTQKLNTVNLEMQTPNAPGLLVFQDVKDSSKIYGCDLANPVIVGRDAACCNIIITGEQSVSRQHCRLFRRGMMCYVEDLQSYNHTFVNGAMIGAPVSLRKGDRLRLGNLELVVVECDMNGKL